MAYPFVTEKINEKILCQTQIRLPGKGAISSSPFRAILFERSCLRPCRPINLARFQILLEQTNQAIGRLDGLASLLPDLSLLLYTYVRKEAVLPSQIEGTQSSLSDLLLYENDEARLTRLGCNVRSISLIESATARAD